MGLSISVGVLAFALEHDPEGAELFRKDFQEVNRVLAAYGLPPHVEPELLPEVLARSELTFDRGMRRGMWLSGMPYSWLHYLRRAVAFARQAPGEFHPVNEGEDPSQDQRIDDELFVMMDSHVICHSDCDGFYVPIDFPQPLHDREDRVTGGIIGSSQRALQELVQAAPLLDIPIRDGALTDEAALAIVQEREGSHLLWIERHAWLYFFDRLRESIAWRTAVVLG